MRAQLVAHADAHVADQNGAPAVAHHHDDVAAHLHHHHDAAALQHH